VEKLVSADNGTWRFSVVMTARMNEVEQIAVEKHSSPTKWKGAPAIQLVHQMNKRCIDLFCDLAIDQNSDIQWPFLLLNRDLWSRLDANSRERLASFPYVLVDVRFGDGAWWQSLRGSTPMATGRDAVPSDPSISGRAWLTLEALMFAWQVAREDRRVAHMVFAMAPTVAASVAALSMQQIRTIGIQSASELHVRWADKPQFWRELLLAVNDGDDTALAELKQHAARRVLDLLRRVSRS
jgi:hypothetical protein